MKTTNNTVLITGGGSGIGFEMAKLLSARGNRVIITGRNAEKLERATSQLKGVTAIQADITNDEHVTKLVETIRHDFPELNLVINNAGQARLYSLLETKDTWKIGQEEMLTNYVSVLRINERLLSLLLEKEEAAIVNVSSVVAYVPTRLVTYSASKSALHAYTQSLRLELRNTPVRVFEVMPPLVNTELSKDVGGETGIAPEMVAQALVDAMESETWEVRIAQTEAIYQLHLSNPEKALEVMNPWLNA